MEDWHVKDMILGCMREPGKSKPLPKVLFYRGELYYL